MNKQPEIYDPSDERSIKALKQLVTPVVENLAAAHSESLRSQEQQRESEQRHRLDVLRMTFEHQSNVLGRVFPLFWGGLVLIGLSIGGAFYVGRPDLAYNVIALAIGWAGGYGYGRSRTRGPAPQ